MRADVSLCLLLSPDMGQWALLGPSAMARGSKAATDVMEDSIVDREPKNGTPTTRHDRDRQTLRPPRSPALSWVEGAVLAFTSSERPPRSSCHSPHSWEAYEGKQYHTPDKAASS